MNDPAQIRIAAYDYPLPESRIAQFPLSERDASELLIYRDNRISEGHFRNIGSHLPENSILVFNNTRVIRARLIFHKPTGAPVEIFCLEPLAPASELHSAFLQPSGTTWKCLIGNLKRWKEGSLEIVSDYRGSPCILTATRTENFPDGSFGVKFDWNPPGLTFGTVLESAGMVPLPPYIHRVPDVSDVSRYQTVFAREDGSVAAPTAGLHFTEPLLQELQKNNTSSLNVTLHVGVGTFRPVNADLIGDHVMHHEKIIVAAETIEYLLNNPERPVFAVGTTSARTLESLYWLGYQLVLHPETEHPAVTQWMPYGDEFSGEIPLARSLEALLAYLRNRNLDQFSGETQLMIVPGYRYRILTGMITNFHMPQSTLLLLVAVLIGPKWREIYDFALAGDYRFLSYGDACLLFGSDSPKNR